ncbi:SAM-dependent methyltransferase [Actinocrispum wychmicini]|uniref:S-adenosyl methyltransferase n=1 Tax=Actinocrispum wychmicini TaxID=1213861 RepID=A0A4R2J424_9PSEU|nr:SAM-dependent methyltransferase [Actinocrispum wychmicini]TCO52447.1 S-adenosyl methyltransferase [Actinocrispum wychmicini]
MDPRQVDITKPSVARVYDAALGGKDNYEIDRAVLRAILTAAPDAMVSARDNREWLIRITRFLAREARISQFLDCGSGLPTAENTHQVAQRINPEATVVYVDNDPIVLAHGRAILAENDRTHLVAADLAKPEDLLAHPDVRRFLDFSQPIALFQIGTLHHSADTAGIQAFMRTYADSLAPGSYIAISHFHNPGTGEDSEAADQMERLMAGGPMGSGYFRTRAEIASFFSGCELVEPGLVTPSEWWPDGPRMKPLVRPQRLFLAGLGRKG